MDLNYMKRFFLINFFAVFFGVGLFAQSPIRVRMANGSPGDSTSMAQLFAGYDFSDVPTGFLSEAGLPQLDLTYFDRSSGNSPCVDFPILCSIVESVKDIDVTVTREWSPSLFPEQSSATSTSFPLWVALYDFNTFSPSASNYVQYSGGHFVKSPNIPASSLYASYSLAAFAPGVAEVMAGSVTMTCRFTENANVSGILLQFDADDGLGYRTVINGQDIIVNYSSAGVKNLSLKVISPSSTYTTFSRLIVKDYPAAYSASLSSTWLQDFNEIYNGEQVFAKLTYHACETTGLPHRPLIIVEGFDPIDLLPGYGYWGTTNLQVLLGNDFQNNSVIDYFDIYYVDWLNSEADIRANAKLLKKIIDYINQRKHYFGSNEENVIVAQSMGGLITQYALRDMEINHHPHEVSHFFSHDVPYYGVTIPSGVLFAIQSLFNYIDTTKIPSLWKDYSQYKGVIEKYLYSISAQQMLINYITPEGEVDHTQFNALQSFLQNRGLPRGDEGKSIVNISVSNGGSSAPLATVLGQHSNHYLSITASCTPFPLLSVMTGGFSNTVISIKLNLTGNDFWGNALSYIPGIAHYEFNLEVSPHMVTNQVLSRFSGVYTNTVLGIPIERTFVNDIKHAPSVPAMDLADGSYYFFNPNINLDEPLSNLSLVGRLLACLAHLDASVDLVPKIQFVPTFSSLRDPEGPQNPNRDYFTSPLASPSVAFDGYFLPDTAQFHTDDFPWGAIDAQTKIYVNCPDTLHVGDLLSLANYNGGVQWHYNSNFWSIDQGTGRVRDIYYELDTEVTAYAYNSNNSVYSSRTKKVHIVPRETAPIYLEPHFYGDTLALEIHSSNYEADLRLQTDSVQRRWFYKWDLEPLVEYHHYPIKFTIVNFSQQNYQYKLTVSAHVTDSVLGYYNQFIDYSFWNNRRIQLIQPTSIIINQSQVFLTSGAWPGYRPLTGQPFVVSLDPTPSGDYTDALISPGMVFRTSMGEVQSCMLDNNLWVLPAFFLQADIQYELETIFCTLAPGEIGDFVIEMINSDGGDPVQTFHIPVVRNDNLF